MLLKSSNSAWISSVSNVSYVVSLHFEPDILFNIIFHLPLSPDAFDCQEIIQDPSDLTVHFIH